MDTNIDKIEGKIIILKASENKHCIVITATGFNQILL